MATRQWILQLLSMVMLFVLSGCGGGGTTLNLRNPSAPAAQSVSIRFQPVPAPSITVNTTISLSATVNNDPTSAGVDWALNCQNSGNCGSLSAAHTASGQATTYTPPPALSSNSQSVNIVAFATVDHSQNVAAPVTITAFAAALKGTFVLQTNGVDVSGFPYQRAGVIVLDGNGAVTKGEQTINYLDPNAGALSSVSDAITGGSYFVGPDGRGTLQLVTGDANIGQQGTETFSIVALSGSRVLLTKTDDLSIPASSNESSTGTMDLQTSITRPSGGFAFVARGTDLGGSAIGVGGILNIDSSNGISGAGSAFDLAVNDGSGTVTPSSAVSGTLTVPDSLGKITIDLATDFASVEFTGYIIDPSHIQFIETDSTTGVGLGVTAGPAMGQGAATGTLTSSSSFAGTYAMGVFGDDLSGTPSSLAFAGTFFTGGTGTLTKGFIDEIQSGMFVQVSDRFHGTYTLDGTGIGRVDTNASLIFAKTVNGTGPELVFYLTGKGTPALILDADVEVVLGGGGVGTGVAYPIASGTSFSGTYGLSFTQNFGGTEADAAGAITVDGTAHILAGTVDTNSGFLPQPNTALSGTFAATTISQRLTGILSNQLFPADLSMAFYPIDLNHGFFVEIDGGPSGVNPGFLAFGFFSGRAPVCSGCP